MHKQLNGVHIHTGLEDSALENSDKLALKLQVSFKDTGNKKKRERKTVIQPLQSPLSRICKHFPLNQIGQPPNKCLTTLQPPPPPRLHTYTIHKRLDIFVHIFHAHCLYTFLQIFVSCINVIFSFTYFLI